MKSCEIYVNRQLAAVFTEEIPGKKYSLQYLSGYKGKAISLTLPVSSEIYRFDRFPAFFDGLLPEGLQLEHALRIHKIDRSDVFSLLVKLGADTIGHVTVKAGA